MIMAAELSGIGADQVQRLRDLIDRAGLPVKPPQIAAAKFLQAMSRDKKVRQKELRFVVLRELGDAFVTSEFDEALLHKICGAGG